MRSSSCERSHPPSAKARVRALSAPFPAPFPTARLQLRFFGKFFGIQNDYYVFEATLQEEGEPPEEGDPNVMPPEEPGTGANSYVYYVCHQPGGPVTKLPDVTPEQVVTARQIKKFLSGDLKAEVSAFPPFPGVEANFLRAQIARIAAATVVCPAGFFAVGEDELTLEKEEEFVPLESVEMMQPENWCHRYPHVKPQVRGHDAGGRWRSRAVLPKYTNGFSQRAMCYVLCTSGVYNVLHTV